MNQIWTREKLQKIGKKFYAKAIIRSQGSMNEIEQVKEQHLIKYITWNTVFLKILCKVL